MKFGEAYRQGKENEPLRHGGRLAKAAHWLGRLGFDADLQQYEHEAVGTMRQAVEQARGLNKVALRVIQAAAEIPHQEGRGKTPLRGVDNKTSKGGLVRQWHTNLAYVPTAGNQIPLISPLGELKLGVNWLPESFLAAPVQNVSIACETPITAYGRVTGPTTTSIRLNVVSEDEDYQYETYHRNFAEGGAFVIGADGTLASFALGDSLGSTDKELPLDTVRIDLEDWIGTLATVVDETVQAYKTLDI